MYIVCIQQQQLRSLTVRVCVCIHLLLLWNTAPNHHSPLLSIYAISEDDPHILPLSTQYSSSNTTTKVAVVLQVLLLPPFSPANQMILFYMDRSRLHLFFLLVHSPLIPCLPSSPWTSVSKRTRLVIVTGESLSHHSPCRCPQSDQTDRWPIRKSPQSGS